MRTRNPNETKDKLLNAAAHIVMQHGANHLTLDQVALEANISKGGLLHHYPTKQALLRGLMDQMGKVFATRLEQYLGKEAPGQPGRWARAYIHASFESDADELQLTSAIASMVSSDPALIDALRQEFAWIDRQLEQDGLPLPKATVIRLACDGLWLAELLDCSSVTEPLRSDLRQELLEMTR